MTLDLATNGHKGNGLSDQPHEVQRLINAQYAQGALRPPTADPAAAKFLDPALFQLFGGLLSQVIGAFTPQKSGAPADAKFLDPALLQLLGNLFGQMFGGGAPRKAAPPVLDKADMKRAYPLGPGHFETFPTWSFWGETRVRLDNTGSVPTIALVGDQRFHLNPGEGTTTSGKWAAFPIRVTNTSELPGSQLTVRVE
ncbi:MAG: hypothetical protein ACTHU0_20385 [Kofleriaceae bacterium]